ncbi:hypothetical protein [Thermococcus sp.]|uniref:hypothetical protein n=1 Tax=Thermococcus sp. TaxID=35749 RepID=UPI002616A2BC|nr:hypothetical protein [Thermococcus sp.]
MDNFVFKVLLSLPLLLLLWDALVNIYYWYFDFSFVVQVSLLLLWGVEVWWVLKNSTIPLPVLIVSAFVVVYIAFVVDNPPKLNAYFSDALWAVLYTYLLGNYYQKSLKGNASSMGEVRLSDGV